MLESAILLLMHTLFPMLRLAPGDSFPRPLSREQEQEALARWAEGDLEARNLLVEHNLRLVAHIVKKYYQAEDADDLISIGTIGLIKGINTYRADKGVRLATYASRCIVSLSDALDVDGEGSGLFLMDVVAQEDDMAERIGSRELCGSLRGLIARTLDAREARIISLRYGLEGGRELTQWETAQRCGISRSYVSRLEKRALEKLRSALENP